MPWRALGLALLVVAVGVASCQALFRLPAASGSWHGADVASELARA